MARPVRLSMVHVHNKLEAMESRRAELLRLVEQAGKEGSNIVVLPERADHHRTHEAIEAVKQGPAAVRETLGLTLDSPWLRELAALARTYRMVVIPSVVFIDGERTWARSPVFGPDGSLVGSYDKTHLAPDEKELFAPGAHLDPVATPFGSVGLLVCYDIHFPEITRVYELKGADILLWQTMKHDRFEQDFFRCALPARAMMHGLPLGVATYAVDDQLWKRSRWNSVIYDAFGQVAAGGIHPHDAVISATLDLDDRPQLPLAYGLQERRDFSVYLQEQRRPELYAILAQKRV